MPILEHRRSRRSTSPDSAAPPLSASELGDELGIDHTRAGHLLATAWALVERYAPAAPFVVHREACIRCAGWLCEQPAGAVRSESEGDISTAYAPTHLGALRHSGAMALLTGWKVRRAGAIG